MKQGLFLLFLGVTTLISGINAVNVHPSHTLAHELFRRQATSEGDCSEDDCIIDECITEESYNAGTFVPCYVEELQVGFTESAVTVDEADGVVTLTIAINAAAWLTSPLTVTYVTMPTNVNAATPNTDYQEINNGQVTFNVGDLQKTISISITVDGELEPDEKFKVDLTSVDCCAVIGTDTVEVTIQDGATETGGDPHFTVPLKSKEILCYSIQGYPGLSFNLISNDHLCINAMFIDSVNDPTEATWIGKLAIVPRGGANYQAVVFDSVTQEVIIKDEGEFKASVIQEIDIYGHNNISVKFTSGMVKQSGNPTVRVVYTKPLAVFDVTFHKNHLDVDWKIQDSMLEHSHGLMGQFMGSEIDVDPTRQILIRPGFDPVPVTKTTAWQYNNGRESSNCWKAMNPGHQGEGLVEGKIFDYMVDNILSNKFIFQKKLD